MNFFGWFTNKAKLKRWMLVILAASIIMCYAIAQLISLNVISIGEVIAIILEFVVGLTVLIYGIIGLQKRTLEIFIEVNGVGAKALEEDNLKIDSLIFDKKIYENGPKVVLLGGGAGTNAVIKGLKKYTSNITAIVTLSDTEKEGMIDSSRKRLNLLPYSNVKKSIAALSNEGDVIDLLLDHDFTSDVLRGLNFGDIYLLAMQEMFSNVSTSIKKSTEVLNISGEVIPVSLDPITVCAELTDYSIVRTKDEIPKVARRKLEAIQKVFIEPTAARPNPAAIKAIEDADIVVVGPGNIYTDIIPILLVKEITESIKNAKAKRVYLANLMTDEGQTEGYKLSEHIKAITDHVGENVFEYCIADTGDIMPEYLRMYHNKGIDVVEVDKANVKKQGVKVIQKDLSMVVDDKIRHNSDIVGLSLMELVLTDIKYSDKPEIFKSAALEAVLKEEKKKEKKRQKRIQKAKKKLKGKIADDKLDQMEDESSLKEELTKLMGPAKKPEEKKKSKFAEKYQERIKGMKEVDNKKIPKNDFQSSFANIFKKNEESSDSNKKTSDKGNAGKINIASSKSNVKSFMEDLEISDESKKKMKQDSGKFNTVSIKTLQEEIRKATSGETQKEEKSLKKSETKSKTKTKAKTKAKTITSNLDKKNDYKKEETKANSAVTKSISTEEINDNKSFAKKKHDLEKLLEMQNKIKKEETQILETLKQKELQEKYKEEIKAYKPKAYDSATAKISLKELADLGIKASKAAGEDKKKKK